MNKIIGLLSIALLIVISVLLQQQHRVSCELTAHLNYQSLGSNQYSVEPIDAATANLLRNNYQQALSRIQQTYGLTQAQPTIIYTESQQTAAAWGVSKHNNSQTHHALSQSCIIIGPTANNSNTIAYELMRAEIAHRTGLIATTTALPTWFIAGAASTVDYQQQLRLTNIKLDQQQISTIKQYQNQQYFFANASISDYQAARLAVQPIINRKQFYSDLKYIADGMSFDQVFNQRQH